MIPVQGFSAQGLWFRPLQMFEDWHFCRELAGDPSVRRVSLDQKPPTFWGHMRWMWRWSRPGPERLALIVDRQAAKGLWLPAGMVRASLQLGGGSEISIALLHAERGRGLGTKALRAITPFVAVRLGGPVYAQIKPYNHASMVAFTRAGYELASAGEHERIGPKDTFITVLRWEAN